MSRLGKIDVVSIEDLDTSEIERVFRASAAGAREHKIPYLGICLGMQVATIEVARHLADLGRATN